MPTLILEEEIAGKNKKWNELLILDLLIKGHWKTLSGAAFFKFPNDQ